MSTRLLEGSQAIAEAMVAAGCRFFAGYPMTPFTEVLEGMAELLPKVGGVCVNAESEIEAVGMCWGAAAGGVRAATGSVGQGLSLMQESLAELSQARLPLVVLNMARGQGDYFQATRGGGHGDYRHIVLAPADLKEAVRLVQFAFHLADTWRNPVMFLGDYYLAHVQETVDTAPVDFGALPGKDWALDGRSSGTPQAKVCSPIIITKRNSDAPVAYGEHLQSMQARLRELERGVEPMFDAGFTEDAEVIVVAYGTPGRFVKHVVGKLREEGRRIGYFRPVTLWPFPSKALAAATRNARSVAVYELNAGQMIDDVRLSIGSERVRFIGGISFDNSAFGIAPAMTVRNLSGLLQQTLEEARVQEARVR
jgi:2-oxoglutarate ferredoxin oxidoreductase subunit alpha